MSEFELRSILVSDFDGTLTQHDFYRLVLEQRLPEGTPNFWSWYLAGKISHFEALRLTFAAAIPGESQLLELADEMELQPGLEREIFGLKSKGWDVVVASAGCRWYIDFLLKKTHVSINVHANLGSIHDGRLMMELPVDSPFFSKDIGIDKAAVVRDALAHYDRVAFAGDGLPDVAPALLVRPELRFARGMLAEVLSERGEAFQRFAQWSDVSRALQEI